MKSTCRWSKLALAGAVLAAGCTGSNGQNSLVSITQEPAGANCANGGSKIQAGLDADGNGVLDPSEVTSTDYICNGDTGLGGQTGLVSTTTEPPGTNCPLGGVKIEVGLDANGNGVLDPTEVNSAATTYACNGSGSSSLVSTTTEPAGANCAAGGTKVEVGLDDNRDGTLDPGEVDNTYYVCDGAGGLVGPGGISSVTSGIHVSVRTMSTDPAQPVSVRFTLTDDRGYPVDINGVYSLNTPISPSFMFAYVETDASGNVLPYVVYTKSGTTTVSPGSYSPLSSKYPAGTLVENGYQAGDYTYTFPDTDLANGRKAVMYDSTKLGNTHVLWIQVTRQTDLVNTTAARTFSATNQPYWFIPNDPSGTPLVREIANPDKCANCHRGFKPEETTSGGAFHGGGRIDVRMCDICHNPARTSNPDAETNVYIHRIHNSENLQPTNLFHGIKFPFPRDIRNCDTCHGGALQGEQSQTRVSQKACGSCHDYVDFNAGATALCTDPVTRDANGLPVPCNHMAGTADDSTCNLGCHSEAKLAVQHAQVVPNSSYFIAAAGYLPAGAKQVSYDVKSVDLVDDVIIDPNKRVSITFKAQQDGVDVPFQTYEAGVTTEMWAGYSGSPSAYFAFAVPQDGIATPADFNATVRGNLKDIWDGAATGTSAGTMTGPDTDGYYTVTLTGVQIPPTVSLLTGGIGYSGSFMQMDVTGYSTGIVIPARNVTKTATGMTARRPIVDTAKCESCHSPLGVSPTFHGAARNDGATCAFCHNPNRTSSGWSATSRSYIHAIHGGRKRTEKFNWHASTTTQGFWDIEFPGPLNDCTACHIDNGYNFRLSTTTSVLADMQYSTVGQGTYSSTSVSISPYVTADDVTSYGTGFSFSSADATSTEATPETLVTSPIVNACTGCHDRPDAVDHMKTMGGHFYEPRSTALAPNATHEECLICHGPGRAVDIEAVH